MRKTQPSSLLPIPATIDPVARRCFKVSVPDDPTHIAAFRGALNALATWQVWQFDDAHSGRDVAAVWRTVTDEISECDMIALRRKPTDFCMLQLSTDGGATWADVFDASDCAHAAAIDEINDAINDGTLSGGGQQPGQGDGTPGLCFDYSITLQANNRWLAPVAVGDGDIITVSQEVGAWWDGNILRPWFCPDGSEFLLGACVPPPLTDGSDPLPSVNHMRIIANLPADTTTPYFDVFDTSYTVPGGVAQGSLWLQANDANLADNQGSITLHVQICKGGWVHVFDFANGDLGWTAFGGFASFNTDHWECFPYDGSGNSGIIRVQYVANIQSEVIAISFEYSVNDSQGGADLRAWPGTAISGAPIFDATDPDDIAHSAHTHRIFETTVSGATSRYFLIAGGAFTTAPVFNLYKVTLRGVGTEPTW